MSAPADYNGWSNYETWLVSMWLNNDQASYATLERLQSEPASIGNRAECLESIVRELYEFEPYGIVADLINNAFARVNWAEIVQAR